MRSHYSGRHFQVRSSMVLETLYLTMRSCSRSIEILRRFVLPIVCAAGCSSGDVTSTSQDGGSSGSGGRTGGTGGHQSGGAGGTSNGGTSGAGGRATGGTGTGGVATGGTSGGGGVGSTCRADPDCSRQNFLYCAAPGSSTGCGICPSPGVFPTCAADADCNPEGGTQICVGACGGACPSKECVQGCIDDTPCSLGTHCGVTHRCEALTCATNGACPANFDCVQSLCARRSCSNDTVCDGFCVTGYCYNALGLCEQPRA